MIGMRALLLSLAACDSIEDVNCCAAITEQRIAACLERKTEPSHCITADCLTGDVVVCRLPDGGIE